MRRTILSVLLGAILMTLLNGCGRTEPSRFVHTTWAPLEGNSFRVNSPDTAGGRYADRWEAKAGGLLALNAPADLAGVRQAELYLELWGGHPGTANKRFSLNGRQEVLLPEVGAADHHCTYSYPTVPLDLNALSSGPNALQFTCDLGEKNFWGHYLLRAAALRLTLEPGHPAVADAGLDGFAATVTAAAADGDTIRLGLDVDPQWRGRIARVDYHARYDGYDDNGNGLTDDWHGYTKGRLPQAIAATADAAPFEAAWNLSMIPDQPAVQVRAVVHFADAEALTYETAPVEVALPRRAARVSLHGVTTMDRPFWSRANRPRTATIHLPADPATIERAQLHVLIWDGGDGGTADHFTVNGHAIPIAGDGHHDVLYRVIDVDPAILRLGANELRLLSATEHHGIEVILPGPALAIRRPAR
ncbi:MAG: hypothetical protein GX591_09300 [Planctomycetes bacterium]|nr:hypothetical protein [Planctomycetota bacterium]